jgi:penicillin G amidase
VDPVTNTYSVDGRWLPLAVRTETIEVRDPLTRATTRVSIEVRESRFGPIITDNGAFDAGADVADLAAHPLALSWTSIDKTINDTTLVAFYQLNNARDWGEFRAALSHYVAPAQNFVYADQARNFGYQMPGLVPRRAPGHTGLTPVWGNVSTYVASTRTSHSFACRFACSRVL